MSLMSDCVCMRARSTNRGAFNMICIHNRLASMLFFRVNYYYFLFVQRHPSTLFQMNWNP